MNKHMTGMIALALAAALTGCVATTTPETDARLGESFTMLKAQQTIDLDASRNTDPVAGVDGASAKGALDNYRDSFRKPPSEAAGPALSISVGGSR